MKYNKPFTGKLGKPEKLSQESKTETAGYVSAERRITSLINAGQRLQDFRETQFDFKDGQEIDYNFYDPTREPGFDLADASMLEQQVKANLEAQQEAFQTAQEASGEAETVKDDQNPVEG